jgi:16S rRNA (cytidine1402-2'-O)-methyltransferase
MESFHSYSGGRKAGTLIATLLAGKSVALVTDAGTPGISDPGASLVRRARDEGVPVVPIPGPSAVGTALSASGLGADRFTFLGFLPRRGRLRREHLEALVDAVWTTVLYESPNRLADTLDELAALLGAERTVVVCREMTKRFEEFRSGTPAELAVYYRQEPVRGEVTIVVEGGPGPASEVDAETVACRARELLEEGNTRKDAVSLLVAELGVARNQAYRIVTKL